ncbi:tRNA lysidine(34) synthetase TilS [Pelagibacteraceae bacterium]|jgi:tRNA(Ile)-lysidine synthase|nr:tRNA lysidine(34) synthetase TilS [Pelagibacteraceae bacterium]
MSKKNLSVNLKNGFNNFKDLSNIFFDFKNKLDNLKKKSYTVAVSGGPDSLALVALTKAYSYTKTVKFHYVLVNHNIRKNSSQEANQVKNLLKKKKINLVIILNKKKIIKNIQGQARNIRYKILSDFCKKKRVSTLLTAHNLEDQVETFFIRLSRGSGLKGLSAMNYLSKIGNNVNLYRPLLETKKKFLIKISKNIFGKYIRDPSNKNEKYLRTKIRNLKKPLEKSGIEYDQIIRSIKNLASSKMTLDLHFKEIFNEMIKKNKKEILVNFDKLKKFNREIKMAIINESVRQLKKNYYSIRSKKICDLINKFENAKFKQATLGGCIFTIKKGNLCLKAEKT